MRRVVLVLTVILPHCGGPGAGTADTGAGPASPVPPTSSTSSICAVGSASTSGPLLDGPYLHQVALARSADGLSVSDSRMIIDHASVPDGVGLPDGTVRIYYVNGLDATIGIARLDGDTVTVIGPVVVNGVRGPSGMADPDAVLLPDGRIRLYYLNNFGPPGGPPRGMCYADSIDGETFTLGGLAFQFSNPERVTDPSVTRLTNGVWLMAASNERGSVLARSTDGATFSDETTVGLGGVPELAALEDGRVRIYVCTNGISAFVSADEGRSWTLEGVVVRPGSLGSHLVCDPSFVAPAGRFIYKIQP